MSLLGHPLPPAFVGRAGGRPPPPARPDLGGAGRAPRRGGGGGGRAAPPPHAERPYVAAEWRDALVVVEQGSLELVGLSGTRRRLERGAILWLWGLPLHALRNPGSVNTRIVGISRGDR